MAAAASLLRGSIRATVGDGEYFEIGTFEVPVMMRMAPVQDIEPGGPYVTLDVPSIRPSLAAGLRAAADELDPPKKSRRLSA